MHWQRHPHLTFTERKLDGESTVTVANERPRTFLELPTVIKLGISKLKTDMSMLRKLHLVSSREGLTDSFNLWLAQKLAVVRMY